MKKVVLALSLALLTAVSIAAVAPAKSEAAVYLGNNGIWYGNVCRNGMYYQFVGYRPVGATCYMPGWGAYGVITNE